MAARSRPPVLTGKVSFPGSESPAKVEAGGDIDFAALVVKENARAEAIVKAGWDMAGAPVKCPLCERPLVAVMRAGGPGWLCGCGTNGGNEKV